MSVFTLITKIIAEVESSGYKSDGQIKSYMAQIKAEAIKAMLPEHEMRELLIRSFETIYGRIANTAVKRSSGKVSRFTIDMVRPDLRKQVDKAIQTSASLIKLNREEAVNKTLRRLAGWATSIPNVGGIVENKVEEKQAIIKALKSLPYVERRVLIDQGHKLNANLNNIIAVGGGAIAVIWHSHWKQSGYNYREDHKERDGKIYMLKGNWALEKGLVKVGGHQYYDTITAFSEEVNCRCYGQYLYNLNDLPTEMLTEKGFKAMLDARRVL